MDKEDYGETNLRYSSTIYGMFWIKDLELPIGN